jgi:hypothetical protein
MDPSLRTKLEKLALERLRASAEDHDEWSYAWGRAGSVVLSYCFWSAFEEFDGYTEGLDQVWTKDRFDLISRGDADLNEDELRQWQEIRCREVADAGEAYTVWIVPVTDEEPSGAVAVFMWSCGKAPEDPPWLNGIFDGVDEAKAALSADGVISKVNPPPSS